MIVFSVLCMMSALIAFEGGIAVLKLNRQSPVNIVYALFAFDFALTCIFFNQFVTSPDYRTAFFWNRMLAFPSSMYASLMFHFSVLLISKDGRHRWKKLLPLLYLPSILIGLMWVLGRSIPDIYQTAWGWDNLNSAGGFWAFFSLFLFITLCLSSFLLVYYRYSRPFSQRNRKQMKPIMYSLLIGTAGWVLSLSLAFSTNDFYHTLVSNIAFLLIVTPVIVGVRIAIARFNLMTLTPQRKAAELISGITQPVFMVDVKGKVIFQNQAAAKLAGISGVGSSYRLFELFLGSDRIRAELENIAEKKNYTESLRLSLREHKLKHATYLLKLQGIKNEADDYIGAICTAEKENSFNGFRNRYGISPRELDVLFLSITVYTNVEIARELGISKRTVEHHHENIYNKLGVNNKLELYNVSAKYGLSVNGAPAEVE